jgi:hypothetical protein
MLIAIVMITKDRMEKGKQNYIQQTVGSLYHSGLLASRTRYEFHIFDGGSKSLNYLRETPFYSSVCGYNIHSVDGRLVSNALIPPNVNAGRALIYGGSRVPDADWVLFLEDDIEVCKDFLDGVAVYVQYKNPLYKVCTFYTPYREVEDQYKMFGKGTWAYPVKAFYGTQAFAIRPPDALSLGNYLCNLSYPTSSYDIEMKNWHGNEGYFLASVPCYVQHIGKDSLLFEDEKRFHQCTSFQGVDWSPFQ